MIGILIVIIYIGLIGWVGFSMYFESQDWKRDKRYSPWLRGYKPLTYKQLNELHDKGLRDL